MGYMKLQFDLPSFVCSVFPNQGYENVVLKLIRAGADVDLKIDGGITALHLASFSGQYSNSSNNNVMPIVLENQSNFFHLSSVNLCNSKFFFV